MGSLSHVGIVFCFANLVLSFPFPPFREVEFSYHADVQVGTEIPTAAASKFTLYGVLKVQTTANQAILQFSDLKTSMYNGENTPNEGQATHDSVIPEESQDLFRPFTLHFEDGSVVGLQGEVGEAEWSLNIKRAVANLLQLETNSLDTLAFTSQENGLYGLCNVEYTVNKNDGSYLVRKFIDHSSCSNFPSRTWSNTPAIPVFCQSGNDDFVTSSSERLYSLSSDKKILSVTAHGGIYSQPLKARSDLHFIFANQTLKYMTEGDITTPIVSKIDSKTDLLYRKPGREYSQERSPLKQDVGLRILKRMLKELSESLEEDTLTRDADKLHNEYVTHALYFMMALELETLRSYFDELSVGTSYHQETLRKLFLELLPKVGTSDSTLFICNLIANDHITSPAEAIQLLTNFPFFIREPSEELLRQCEVIFHLSKEKHPLHHHMGVLSFATLVNRVCKKHCSPETQENYVRKYVDRFTGVEDYGSKMLYLEGLSNIEDGKVFEYLEPLIKAHGNVHLRFLAVWASMNVAGYHLDQVYKVYWPILMNVSEPLEIRVAALTMLVISKPSTGRFFSLHWFMSHEKDARLKHFYYTTLQSLANTKDPCYSLMSMFAARVLRLLPAPPAHHWATGNYVFDHADDHRGFGEMVQLFLIGDTKTDLPNIFYLKLSSFGTGMQLLHFSVYLKLTGVARGVKERLLRLDPNNVKIKQLADILKSIKASPTTSEEIHLEMLLKSQDQVIACLHINETTFHMVADLISQAMELSLKVHQNLHQLGYVVLYEHTIPTDFGIPAFAFLSNIGLTSLRGNDTQEVTDSQFIIDKQLEFRFSVNSINKLQLYNPVVHVWHGILQSFLIQLHLPINGSLKIDTNLQSLSFNVVREPGEVQKLIAHVHSETFVLGEESEKKLHLHCPTCRKNFPVTKGDQYKYSNMFLDVGIQDLGLKLQGEVFDCEHHITLQVLESAIKQQNYNVFPLMRPLVAVSHAVDSWAILSQRGTCGTEIRLMNINDETYELEGVLQFSTVDSKTLLTTSMVQKMGQKTLYEWSFNTSYHRHGDLFDVDVNIMRDVTAVQDFRKMCLNMNLVIPAAPANKYIVEASKPMTADVTMNLAAEGGDVWCGGEPARMLPFNVRITAETTEEQRQLAAAASVWPFNSCKKNNNTWACEQAAHEMATLRKYSLLLNHSQPLVPELFEVMSFAKTPEGTFVITVEVSSLSPVAYITLGTVSSKLDMPRNWINSALLNTQYPVLKQIAMSLGLSNFP